MSFTATDTLAPDSATWLAASDLGLRLLSRVSRTGDYLARLATRAEDLRAAQALRFAVFNIEHRHGLPGSFFTGLDADPFDPVCDHLLVESVSTGEIVGTYRLQTGASAAANLGYYSELEFDLACLEPVRSDVVELGRACVHRDHRNQRALALLWRGIARYALDHGARYLVGCSSINSREPSAGAAVFASLSGRSLAPSRWWTRPRPEWACPLHRPTTGPTPRVPRLLAAYLSLGAKICAPPAIDREFGTIDFLTLLDLAALPPATSEKYFRS